MKKNGDRQIPAWSALQKATEQVLLTQFPLGPAIKGIKLLSVQFKKLTLGIIDSCTCSVVHRIHSSKPPTTTGTITAVFHAPTQAIISSSPSEDSSSRLSPDSFYLVSGLHAPGHLPASCQICSLFLTLLWSPTG